MSFYRHILVGLDLSKESQQVIDRVKELIAYHSGEKPPHVSLMHIQESLSFAYGGDIPMDLSEIQSQISEQAHKHLKNLAKQLNVAPDDLHVVIGKPSHEMHDFAEKNDVDLIVVGSHGRHGMALIFGSTTNSVLHGANCDILAVRINE